MDETQSVGVSEKGGKIVEQTEHDQISANLTQVNEIIQKLTNDISVIADYMYGEVDTPQEANADPGLASPGIMGQVSDALLVTLALLREANEALHRLQR